MRSAQTLALALAIALAGCAPRLVRPPQVERVVVGGARFEVQYGPDDAGAAREVIAALPRATERVARWGGLAAPVRINIHPGHAELEAAVRREGYGWLRAWAGYSTVDLQSPRTWSLFGASEKELAELLTHELSHCATYQQASSEYNWPYKGTPLWFLEGLASVTADQGYRRRQVEDLWRYYSESVPGAGGDAPASRAVLAASLDGDPIADPERLYQEKYEVVYGAAHHAFRFLLDRYGEERIRRILALMGQGKTFARAFEEVIGISEPEFAADFRHYVVWQGWRRER
jgi:hypothetical protein